MKPQSKPRDKLQTPICGNDCDLASMSQMQVPQCTLQTPNRISVEVKLYPMTV